MSSERAGTARGRGARIALWGNFGTLNLGNECTLSAVIHNLHRLAPDADLTCVCPEPADAGPRHRIPAVRIGFVSDAAPSGRWAALLRKPVLLLREFADWLRVFRHAMRLDALLVVGTGVLTDSGEGTLGLPYQLMKWSLATRLLGGRVLFVSVGMEEVTGRVGRATILRSLRLAAFRSFRDDLSRDRAARLGAVVSGDHVYPDLAFSLPSEVLTGAAAAPSGAGAVGVGIYNYRGRGLGGPEAARAYQNYLRIICDFIVTQLGRGLPVRVIIGDYAYDEAVRLDVRAELEKRGALAGGAPYADEPARSFEEVLEQLRSVELLVASRFHNVLLALLLGRPVVSISYDQKNDALMAGVGLASYCQPIDSLDAGRLAAQFDDLERNASLIRGPLAASAKAYRARLEEQYAQLLATIARGT